MSRTSKCSRGPWDRRGLSTVEYLIRIRDTWNIEDQLLDVVDGTIRARLGESHIFAEPLPSSASDEERRAARDRYVAQYLAKQTSYQGEIVLQEMRMAFSRAHNEFDRRLMASLRAKHASPAKREVFENTSLSPEQRAQQLGRLHLDETGERSHVVAMAGHYFNVVNPPPQQR